MTSTGDAGRLTIRVATIADVSDLAGHYRRQAEAVLKYAVALEIVPDTDWHAYALSRLRHPSTHVLIATEAGRTIGSVELRLFSATSASSRGGYRLRPLLRAFARLLRSRMSAPARVVRETGLRGRLEHVFVEPDARRPLLFRRLINSTRTEAIAQNVAVLDTDVAAANIRLRKALGALGFEDERILMSTRLDGRG